MHLVFKSRLVFFNSKEVFSLRPSFVFLLFSPILKKKKKKGGRTNINKEGGKKKGGDKRKEKLKSRRRTGKER